MDSHCDLVAGNCVRFPRRSADDESHWRDAIGPHSPPAR